jgi:uncharacterized protein (DUF433 family)
MGESLMPANTISLTDQRTAAITPLEAAWLTQLSPKTINATIDRGELKGVKKRGRAKKRARNLAPADVLYLMLRKELAELLSASAKRELYQRLSEVQLGMWSNWKSRRDEQCDFEIRLGGGFIRIELKSTCSRLADRWRALRNANEIVVSDPNIRAGEPVIRGTRVPAYMIADLAKQGAEIPEILEDYPALSAQMVEAVLAYAQMNPKRGRPPKAPWASLKRAG